MILDFRVKAQHIRRLMWGAVGSALLTVALGGYWFTRVVWRVGDDARHQSLALLHMEDAVTTAQFALVRQTQEWKDMLLRAYDPDLLARHRSLFERGAADMQLHLQQTLKVIRDNGMDTANLADLQNQEQTLLDEYAAALGLLDARDPLSYRRADQLMRGKDRALRDGLAGWHAKLEAETEHRAKGFGAAGLTGTTQFYGLGLLAVLLPLLSLTAFIAAYRALREIGRGDAGIRAIYQSIGDAVLVADMRGQVESLNATAQKLTGWSDDEARGKALPDVFQLYDANNRSRVDSPAEIVLRDGCPIPMSNGMLLRRRDGNVLPVEGSAAPVLDERGKTIGVVMVFHDVSQRYAMLSDLRHERALFKQTFNLAAVGMAHLGMDGKWLRVNPKLCEITGYSEAELLQLSFKGITHPDDMARDLDKMRDLVSHHIDAYHTEKRYIRKDGRSVWVALSVSIVWKEDGTPDYGISIIEDIQSRKDAEREGTAAQKQYRSLFDQMPEGVLLIDENMRVIAHNRKALLELEYDSAALLQLHVRDFEAASDKAAIASRLQKLQETGSDTYESRYRTRSGRVLEVDVSVQRVHLPDGRAVLQTLFRDITAQKQAAAEIEHLAYHDQLTGLANRRLLQDRIAQALGSAARRDAQIALLYLDLDHFKDVNDSIGHQAGDHLLQSVAGRLLGCIRKEDTLARIGGDEFVIMLSDVGRAEDVVGVAHKIIREINLPFKLGHNEMNVTPSIGISMYPQDGRDSDTLLKHADAALYQAKQAGRATFRFFTSALHDETLERLNIQRLLGKAVGNREFELYYQPQVRLRDGVIVGCEALIRWNPPGIEQVMPARFIPVAEHSDLIVKIGEWVIREVCGQSRAWQDQGLNIKIAFNVSARQFTRPPAFLVALRGALAATGANPALLEIELTESLLLDQHGIGEVLGEIRALGIHLALDDFGTGYSSLSYLHRLPINILKIDRSFISGREGNGANAEMVKTIIGMAHNLKMGVIAEGVETSEQSLLLASLGCEVGQGYYYSRPVPAAEFVGRCCINQNSSYQAYNLA